MWRKRHESEAYSKLMSGMSVLGQVEPMEKQHGKTTCKQIELHESLFR